MRYFFTRLAGELESGRPAVLASIVGHAGSTPRSSGALMAMFPEGDILGSVGGGVLEAKTQKLAPALFASGGAVLKPFLLTGTEAASLGMACGGDVTVFALAIPSGAGSAALYRDLAGELDQGRACALVTELEGPDGGLRVLSRRLARQGEKEEAEGFSKPGRLPKTLRRGDSLRILEPFAPPSVLYVAGAGHVAYFISKLADRIGFKVIVLDDRAEFANAERFPEAAGIRVVPLDETCLPGDMGPNDFVVIVTRGHLGDAAVLSGALRTQAGYIGMIGSKKKKAATYAALKKEGVAHEDLDRVHCPIGLSIGAETPEEIAVSVAAELILARSGADRPAKGGALPS